MARLRDHLAPTFHRVWNSPVILSWAAMLVRTVSVIIAIPLILLRLSEAEATLWFLLTLVSSLVVAFDFGGIATLTRLTSYGTGGASIDQIYDFRTLRDRQSSEPNIATIARVTATSRVIYWGLGFASALVLATLGSWAMNKPVSELSDPGIGWTAWAIVTISTSLIIFGGHFVVYLQGTNHLTRLRRRELYIAVGQAWTIILVLLASPSLLLLVVAAQSWYVIQVISNLRLCRQLGNFGYSQSHQLSLDATALGLAWSKLWRAGVGIAISFGLPRATGLVHAQFASGLDLTSYLLGLRLIGMVNQFATAPFYSKLPTMAQYVAGHRVVALIRDAGRGISLSLWSYVFGFLAVGLAGTLLLPLTGTSAEVFDPQLWGWLGVAFFLERYSSHYLQIYSLTNNIHWHIINGTLGAIYLLTIALTIRNLGVIAFPLGMIVAYAGFHGPVNVFLAYRTFRMPFPKFEIRTSLGPALVLAGYILISNTM